MQKSTTKQQNELREWKGREGGKNISAMEEVKIMIEKSPETAETSTWKLGDSRGTAAKPSIYGRQW